MKLAVTADPGDLGFDARRLDKIGEHFRSYLDDNKLAGWLVHVARRGESVYLETGGMADLEAGLPIEHDTIFRIFSMTKPITSVAAMILVERGKLDLSDPLAKYIPSFADVRIYTGGPYQNPTTTPATQEVLISHLLTHLAGFTYGFHYAHPTDAIYRANGFEWGWPEGMSLEQCCDAWAKMPLVCNPGSEWNYSVATDIVGRIVEIVSGMRLDEFFSREIFQPLGMIDTAFYVAEANRNRLAALYVPSPETGAPLRFDELGKMKSGAHARLSGGGGLVSTAHDYFAFATMLLNGGALDDKRILKRETVDLMTTNHLPGNRDLEQSGKRIFSEVSYSGVGFGLGFSVVIDQEATGVPASVGTYSWGGAASTVFMVDPAKELTTIFMTQLLPSSTYPIRPELTQLVYGALRT